MTARVLWHGRDVGILGCDSAAEIAYRCKVEDLSTMHEDALAKLLRDEDAEHIVEDLTAGYYTNWTDQDFFRPLVDEALDFLVDNPGEEWEGFTLRLPEERVFWWSAAGGGDLLPVEGASPLLLAEAMVRADRRAAAHFAVYHYLVRIHGQPFLDLKWERDLVYGLMAVDDFTLHEMVADILEEHWDDLLGRHIVMGGNRDSGDLFTLNNGPEE